MSIKALSLLIVFAVAVTAQQMPNIGCATFDANSVCVKCADRYVLDASTKICMPVSPFCRTYDSITALCTSCYVGFNLQGNGECKIAELVTTKIANCVQYNTNGVCLKCDVGFTLSANSCLKIDPHCAQYSLETLKCSQCNEGYYLDASQCKLITIPRCLAQSGSSCTRCEADYLLYSGACIIVSKDPNCEVSSNNGACTKCASTYLLTSIATCVKMSPLCAKYSPLGECLTCQPEFVLSKGFCVLPASLNGEIANFFDPFCARFEKGVCVQCSWGYFSQNGTCKQVSPNCKTFDDKTGACLTCFSGFELVGKDCVLALVELDPNCHKFNGLVCVECSRGAYFDKNGKCILSDPFCKDVLSNGVCSSCYPGYIMNAEGKCVIDRNFNCYDWSNGKCNKCSKGYYLKNGLCLLINPLCKSFDMVTEACKGCYNGYFLLNGECIDMIELKDNPNVDIYCNEYALDGTCVKCAQRYYLQSGRCMEVSPYCKDYNKTYGYCTACYNGYELNTFGECRLK